MKKLNQIFLGLIAVSISLVFVKGVYSAPYGMAGCGLGSLIIKDNNILQIFAATTNGTFGSQTFGITTGTSNCTPDSKAYLDKQKEIFVTVNYESLETEMAIGEGEKLKSFSELMGCDYKTFSNISKTYYKDIFTKDSTPKNLIQKIKVYTESKCL